MMKNRLPAVLAAALLCACAAQTTPREAKPPQAGGGEAARSTATTRQDVTPAPAAPPAARTPAPADGQAPGRTTQQEAELQMKSARIGDREALGFHVPFSADGTAVRLSPEAERSLAAIAVRAERVQLRESFEGGAAADYAPELRDERLRAARAFLIERGIPADRIEIVKPAGRPVIKPGNSGTGGRGPVVEILLQLPEPGAAGAPRGR